MRMVLGIGAEVKYSSADFVGHTGPVQMVSHVVVHSRFATVTGHKEIASKLEETEAYEKGTICGYVSTNGDALKTFLC